MNYELTARSAWSGRTLERSTSIWDTAAFVKNVTVNGWSREFELNVHDFPGEQTLSRTRRGLYLNVRVLLICFDVSNIESLENVQEMWVPEADEFLHDVPRVLVGCKKDLRIGREDPLTPWQKKNIVSPYKAEKIAHETEALAYFETSATRREGLDELFEYMAEVSVSMTKSVPKPLPKSVVKKDWGIRKLFSRT
ncbi:P-loop containing nucleoside triphosphate hydrolase protein [Phaeosphaeriaceae sp. SRC1lsM3a]|nr:P-loop containing nucleoside triphosphate hydrolase protein [Stagonospora sp. SRC1lsM3a]